MDMAYQGVETSRETFTSSNKSILKTRGEKNGTKKRVTWCISPWPHDTRYTWACEEYNRSNWSVSMQNVSSPISELREYWQKTYSLEVNDYKMTEMVVHKDSRKYTTYSCEPVKRDQKSIFNQQKKLLLRYMAKNNGRDE